MIELVYADDVLALASEGNRRTTVWPADIIATEERVNEISKGAADFSYIADLNQATTSDPQAAVISNSFPGTPPVWARTGVGVYTLTFANTLPDDVAILPTIVAFDTLDEAIITGKVTAATVVTVKVYKTDKTAVDNWLGAIIIHAKENAV